MGGFRAIQVLLLPISIVIVFRSRLFFCGDGFWRLAAEQLLVTNYTPHPAGLHQQQPLILFLGGIIIIVTWRASFGRSAEESPRPIDQLPWRTTEWAGHNVINLIQWLRVIRARGRREIGS